MNVKQAKEIQIGGKKRLIKFGTNASAIYCEERKVSLSQYQNELSFDNIQVGQMRDLIWSALKAGSISKGKEVDFSKYDVGDWIDELDQDTLEEIWDIMNPGDDSGKGKRGKS